MAHLALYREWRPKIFDEVVEQKHAVFALRQSVISGQIAHAYLFSGTRGTGKTTLAKIFARAINCLEPQNGNPCNQCAICRGMLDGSLMDIVEMDAASNNSVDNIRRICDEVVFMPAQARFKVYIIDEVHMLSTGAFNALLKTLEEPPAHAVFILATTEPHRIPATILSRCQRYEFRRIPVASIIGRLAEIAKASDIEISADALQTIASLADGAMRDAISLLDQSRASFAGSISRDDILTLAGVVHDEFMQQMAQAMIHAEAPALLELVDQLVMDGRDLARFVTDLAQYFRNILICQVSDSPQLLVHATSDALAGMSGMAAQISSSQLVDLIKGLSALLSDLRWAADARTALEIGLIRLMSLPEIKIRPIIPVCSATSPEQHQSSPVLPAMPVVTKALDLTPVPAPVVPPAVEPPVLPVRKPVPEATPISAYEPEPPPETVFEQEPDFELEFVPAASPEPAPAAASPEPAPAAAAPEQASAAPAPEPAAPVNADELWKNILDYLMNEGHMTLYLFGRAARPRLRDGTLQLLFSASEQVNYDETDQASARKLLRATASRLAGCELDVQPVLQKNSSGNDGQDDLDKPAAGNDDWIRKIQKTADTLGIPVKMEE